MLILSRDEQTRQHVGHKPGKGHNKEFRQTNQNPTSYSLAYAYIEINPVLYIKGSL